MSLSVTSDDTLAVRAGNLALHNIGVSQTIAALSEASREALTIAVQFEHNLRACLREFDWPFATKYVTLADPTGTVAAQVNPDWYFAYAYPDDCVKARRLVDIGTGRRFNRAPIPWIVGREGDAKVIYTNEGAHLTAPEACLEYTAIFDCPQVEADELFIGALAWRLAAAIAPALSQSDKMHDKAWAMYLHTLTIAESVAANESEREKAGEASWIDARK